MAAWLMTMLMVVGILNGCGGQSASNISIPTQNITTEAARQTNKAETESTASETTETQSQAETISEDGTYTSKEEVALYIHTYNKLPSNYITKKEAEKLGWESKKGNMEKVAPGKSIGGSHFGNYDGNLPDKKGRKYYECDIDFDGGYRGAKRIIYSNDGLVFYTEDHYKTFEQLY